MAVTKVLPMRPYLQDVTIELKKVQSQRFFLVKTGSEFKAVEYKWTIDKVIKAVYYLLNPYTGYWNAETQFNASLETHRIELRKGIEQLKREYAELATQDPEEFAQWHEDFYHTFVKNKELSTKIEEQVAQIAKMRMKTTDNQKEILSIYKEYQEFKVQVDNDIKQLVDDYVLQEDDLARLAAGAKIVCLKNACEAFSEVNEWYNRKYEPINPKPIFEAIFESHQALCESIHARRPDKLLPEAIQEYTQERIIDQKQVCEQMKSQQGQLQGQVEKLVTHRDVLNVTFADEQARAAQAIVEALKKIAALDSDTVDQAPIDSDEAFRIFLMDRIEDARYSGQVDLSQPSTLDGQELRDLGFRDVSESEQLLLTNGAYLSSPKLQMVVRRSILMTESAMDRIMEALQHDPVYMLYGMDRDELERDIVNEIDEMGFTWEMEYSTLDDLKRHFANLQVQMARAVDDPERKSEITRQMTAYVKKYEAIEKLLSYHEKLAAVEPEFPRYIALKNYLEIVKTFEQQVIHVTEAETSRRVSKPSLVEALGQVREVSERFEEKKREVETASRQLESLQQLQSELQHWFA